MPTEIPISKGGVVIVDDEDADVLSSVKWYLHPVGYAQGRVNGSTMLMHRVILNAAKGVEVDHRNGNRLDNRKENLRLCRHAQNMKNRRLNKNSKAGVKGVQLDASSGRRPRWRARITTDGKCISLGRFDSKEDAGRAYREASARLHGDFGRVA